jgi:hypothetical protein
VVIQGIIGNDIIGNSWWTKDKGLPTKAAHMCYIFGNVAVTAGVARHFPKGDVTSKHSIDIERPSNVQLDLWIDQILKILPDVLWSSTLSNLSAIDMWSDVDEYVRSGIQLAFTATWETLDQNFSRDRSQIVLHRDLPFVHASVKPERVYLWLILNMSFALSGILHIILQRQSSRPPVIDTAAVVITTDVSRLLDDERVEKSDWRNMSYVTKEDVSGPGKGAERKRRILLKLESSGDGFAVARKDQ